MASKTKARIIEASLQLFNEQGERRVTTNHIAAHLSISPGNLYYHYRNKADIIYQLFLQCEAEVDALLEWPADRPFTMADRNQMTQDGFQIIWKYRFMHRDLETLLDADERLHKRFQAFATRSLDNIETIYRKLCQAGIMQIPEAEIRPLAINLWMVMINWSSFLRTVAGLSDDGITEALQRRGIYQMLALELPYIAPAYREQALRELQDYLAPFALDSAGEGEQLLNAAG